MKSISTILAGLNSGRYNVAILAFAFVMFIGFMPGAAFAQGSDPFATATAATNQVASTFKTFALAVGAIGMISCLLLGFFGKLNWKWVATGIGVSFAIAIVTPAIQWLNGLG